MSTDRRARRRGGTGTVDTMWHPSRIPQTKRQHTPWRGPLTPPPTQTGVLVKRGGPIWAPWLGAAGGGVELMPAQRKIFEIIASSSLIFSLGILFFRYFFLRIICRSFLETDASPPKFCVSSCLRRSTRSGR